MPWVADRTPRNTLYVRNTDDLRHFEAANEEEAQETIASVQKIEEDAKKAAEEAESHTNDFTPTVGDAPTLRVN